MLEVRTHDTPFLLEHGQLDLVVSGGVEMMSRVPMGSDAIGGVLAANDGLGNAAIAVIFVSYASVFWPR